MSAVIRIKRHLNEEPQEAFVLNCKKRKTDGIDITPTSGETSTVLKFAGTVNQDTNLTAEHIAKLTKDEAKEIVARKRAESNVKSRMDQNREKSQQNRFKIVNYTRELSETAEKSSAANLTIVDVEKDRSLATTSSSSYSDISDEYVYDIYIGDTGSAFQQYPDSIDLNDLSILEYNDYLYSRPRLMDSDSEEEVELGDDDSNDENNFRNDYPDEDQMSDNESIGERDMRRAMNNVDVGFDLSSDEENENGFVYSVDSEAISFEDDLDYCDVNRYGEAYARYKKRALQELGEEDEVDDSASDDDEQESFHSD